MKTTKALIATATPSAADAQWAQQDPQGMLNIREEISPEACAMLASYQDELNRAVWLMAENDGTAADFKTRTDFALRHALGVALKATRAANKLAHGEWAQRKLRAMRMAAL
jgi:HD-GYP domain-containing protein (c-di-GMP phosphodiesterase class II)